MGDNGLCLRQMQICSCITRARPWICCRNCKEKHIFHEGGSYFPWRKTIFSMFSLQENPVHPFVNSYSPKKKTFRILRGAEWLNYWSGQTSEEFTERSCCRFQDAPATQMNAFLHKISPFSNVKNCQNPML